MMLSEAPVFDLPAGHTAMSARANSNGHVVITRPGDMPRLGWIAERLSRVTAGGVLISFAAVLLLLLATAMGVTSFHAQFAYIFATKHQRLPSVLEAIGLDAGAVIFSILGIALARLGRRAIVERILVVLCALGSGGMNALNANLGSPRSVAVWALPPVLFALTSDRLIAVVRRAALGKLADDESQCSAWAVAGRTCMYLIRFALAPPSTFRGARQALLNATPLPQLDAPDRKAIDGPARPPKPPRGHRRSGPTKTQRFLDLVIERHGPLARFPLADVSRVATALAPEVGLHPGSARTALKAAVMAAQDRSAS
jgi:hypothetical protein